MLNLIELKAKRAEYHGKYVETFKLAQDALLDESGKAFPTNATPAEAMQKAKKYASDNGLYLEMRNKIDAEINALEAAEKATNGFGTGEGVSVEYKAFSDFVRNPLNKKGGVLEMGIEKRNAAVDFAHQMRMLGYKGKSSTFFGTVDATTGGALTKPADIFQTLVQDKANLTWFDGALQIPTSSDTMDMMQFVWNPTPASHTQGDEITAETLADITGKTVLTLHDHALLTSLHNNTLTDLYFPLEALILSRFARSFGILVDNLCLNGAGGAKEPLGILNTTGLNNIDQIDKDFISPEDFIKLTTQLKAQYRMDGAFIMNRTVYQALLLMRDGSGGAGTGQFLMRLNFADAASPTLLGFPIKETEYIADTSAAGDCTCLFGSLSNYLIPRKPGLAIAMSEHSKFSYNMTQYRGIIRFDGSVILKEAWARLNKGALN